jgi:hypothetical protein
VVLGWGDSIPISAPRRSCWPAGDVVQPMSNKMGMARLVVPGDKHGGRYVATVKSIELHDPGPAQP